MDFNYKKPLHLFALLGVIGSILLFIGYPLFSLFSTPQIPSLYNQSMTPMQRLTFEMSLLFVQFLAVFAGLILVPILWYVFVNRISFKEMFSRLLLRRERLDQAILWGLITIVVAFAVTMTIGLVYLYLTKVNPNNLSNIPDLQQLFSVPSLYLLVSVQPFCEEFFFRGFLLEKITKVFGTTVAIISTAILFGISHLSYTYVYTAGIAIILGLLFATVVVRIKNLYSAIFAHTTINIMSLTLYFFGKSFGM